MLEKDLELCLWITCGEVDMWRVAAVCVCVLDSVLSIQDRLRVQ